MTNQPSLRDRLHDAERLNDSRAARRQYEERETTTEAEETVTHGRSPATPFLLLGGVAATVWAIAAVVALAALLIWWLV